MSTLDSMKRRLLVSGIVVGCLLALGPLWGMLGTAFSMNRAYTVLGSDGVTNPQALAGSIGNVLFFTTAGFVACPIGIILGAVCIVFLVRLKKPELPPALPLTQ